MKERRNTKQRALILEAVKRSDIHPTAEQIFQQVRVASPRISRGTVYRNLNLLSEMGEIVHLDMPDVDRFDWRRDEHYHLRCTCCGQICDAPVEYQQALDKTVAEHTLWRALHHQALFEGLCPQCAEKAEKAEEAV